MTVEHFADPDAPDLPVCGAGELSIYVPPTTIAEHVTCDACLLALDAPEATA